MLIAQFYITFVQSVTAVNFIQPIKSAIYVLICVNFVC